jgi:2-polyprenyl-3-methyl-5-hydroxy-6-metoxy-1,4-benzoquinol methylase
METAYLNLVDYSHAEEFKRLRFVIDQVKALGKTDLKILDIGCGNGNISLALGSLGFHTTGVDVDAGSIENAKKRNPFTHVQFELKDADAFSIEGKYDVIICSEVLEHLHKPAELVKQWPELLEPQGICIVTVPNGHGPREVIMTKPMQWLLLNGYAKPLNRLKRSMGYNGTTQSANPDLMHVQFFSRKELIELMKENHFELMSFGKAEFAGRIFPVSLLTNRLKSFQELDCKITDFLPYQLAGGFYSAWRLTQ